MIFCIMILAYSYQEKSIHDIKLVVDICFNYLWFSCPATLIEELCYNHDILFLWHVPYST